MTQEERTLLADAIISELTDKEAPKNYLGPLFAAIDDCVTKIAPSITNENHNKVVASIQKILPELASSGSIKFTACKTIEQCLACLSIWTTLSFLCSYPDVNMDVINGMFDIFRNKISTPQRVDLKSFAPILTNPMPRPLIIDSDQINTELLNLLKDSGKNANTPLKLSDITGEAATEEPKHEPPTVEQPTIETPKVEQPTVEQPTVETPKVEQPTVEQPTVEEPKVEPPTVEQPTVEEPKVEPPTVEQPTVEEPKVEPPTVEQPTVEEPKVEPPTVEQPTVEEPKVEPPTVEQPTVETPIPPTAPDNSFTELPKSKPSLDNPVKNTPNIPTSPEHDDLSDFNIESDKDEQTPVPVQLPETTEKEPDKPAKPHEPIRFKLPVGFGKPVNNSVWNTPVITDFGYPFLNFSSEAILHLFKTKNQDDKKRTFKHIKLMLKEAKKRYGGIWKAIYGASLELFKKFASDPGTLCVPNYLKVDTDVLAENSDSVSVTPIKYFSIDPEYDENVEVPRDFLENFYDVLDYTKAFKIYAKYSDGFTQQEFLEEIYNNNTCPFYLLIPKQAKFSRTDVTTGSLFAALFGGIRCVMVKTIFKGKRGCFLIEKKDAMKLYSDIN